MSGMALSLLDDGAAVVTKAGDLVGAARCDEVEYGLDGKKGLGWR
jgi:hypothetical protein